MMEALGFCTTLCVIFGTRYFSEEYLVFSREVNGGVNVCAYWVSKQLQVTFKKLVLFFSNKIML